MDGDGDKPFPPCGFLHMEHPVSFESSHPASPKLPLLPAMLGISGVIDMGASATLPATIFTFVITRPALLEEKIAYVLSKIKLEKREDGRPSSTGPQRA